MAKITLSVPNLRNVAFKSTATVLSLAKGIKKSTSSFTEDVKKEMDKPEEQANEADSKAKRKLPFDFARKA